MNKKSVLVIGGGAAGMMAAIFAAENGAAVTLLEPNERLGKKLNITGKGRCNVTNNAGMEELLQNIPRNGKFLYSAFSHFDGRDAMAFFEGLGVPLKTERGNRVFPVSDRSFDISAALERRLKSLHVRLVRDRAVRLCMDGEEVTGAAGEQQVYPAQAVILAAYPIPPPVPPERATVWPLLRATPSHRCRVPWSRCGSREISALPCRGSACGM